MYLIDMNVEDFCKEVGCTMKEFNMRVKDARKFLGKSYTEKDYIEFAKYTFFGGGVATDISVEELSKIIEEAFKEIEMKKEC